MRLSTILFPAITGIALVLSGSACSDSAATPAPITDAGRDTATITPAMDEVDLRITLRNLFEDRVVWTRAYLVDTIDGLPGKSASAARLMKNGEDFGAAITPFYGAPAGAQLTALMNEAVGHAAKAVDAAMKADSVGFQAARNDWYATADKVAAMLAGANPAWDAKGLSGMLRTCIDDAVSEASSRMEKRYADDVVAFDAHKVHAYAIADAFSKGIVAQFPAKVGPKGTSKKTEELAIAMRGLFFDRSTFVRFFLVDAVAKSPSLDTTVARLRKNNRDIGGAVKPFYGDANGDKLTALLDAGLNEAAAAVAAAVAGDQTAFAAAKGRWYDEASKTATFLAAANPGWKEADLKALLHGCIDDALAEATTRMQANWPAEVAAHDALLTHARVVGDALGRGVAAQFP